MLWLRDLRAPRAAETVREVHGGRPRERDRICLFAHFDPQGRIDPYVEHHIRVLASSGFDVILSSTSQRLDADDVRRVLPLCRAVMRRDNIGLDFGSWQAAMATFPDVWTYDRMLLTNDTLFGPFSDLGAVFAKMENAAELVCGLNDSLETAPHLQSFFLYFKSPLLQDPAFRRFWQRFRFSFRKRRIIDSGEIGLSQYLMKAGYQLFPVYPIRDLLQVAQAMGQRFQYHERLTTLPVNASLMMWDILLTDFDYPYIKAELLRSNRFDSRAVANWRVLIPPSASAVADDVERYLKRVGVFAVPLPDDGLPRPAGSG
ncbi:MAG: rhamnan synthesis F family protein [Chloroflexota bacterium]|nr:rhamnan synthesis F family protein [Chloroflexota bacterium]